MLSLRPAVQIRYWITVLAGVAFALLVWKIMSLQFRYVLAISAGIVIVSVAMMAVRNLKGFLVYALIFNIPFARFSKYFFIKGQPWSYAMGISLGLAEVLIVLGCLHWFWQVFVSRKRQLPRLQKIDYFIMLLLLTQGISFLGAPNKALGIFDIVYNIKHALIYFLIAQMVKRHHLKYVIAIFLFAIFVESSIACYERLTGNVGIGFWKGAVKSSQFGTQYEVPGIEHVIRSEGTTKDSHALGLYYAMLLPIPLVFMAIPAIKPPIRIGLAGVLIMGTIGLVVTFSRSGWLSFAISSLFATCVIVFLWRRRLAIFIPITIVLIVSILYPQGFQYIYDRLFNAPPELIETRADWNHTAFNIWRSSFLFGYGPGNYLCALQDLDITIFGRDDLPVHNAFLHVAAELGLFGVIAFFGIIFLAMVQCFKMLKCRDPLIRGLSLVVLTALFAYVLDGITDPMFREAVPYAQLWVYLGLAMALKRLVQEQTPARPLMRGGYAAQKLDDVSRAEETRVF
jgi:hypothetical protein